MAPELLVQESKETAERSADSAALLDLLDDSFTQHILVSLSDGPKPARRLVEECDASRATVYRRLSRLEEHGLVAVETECHPRGHHRNRYRLLLDRVTLEVGADGLRAGVELEDADEGDTRRPVEP